MNLSKNHFRFQINELVLELDLKKAEEKLGKCDENVEAFSFAKLFCTTSPLLRQPLLTKCMLVFTIQFCALLGYVLQIIVRWLYDLLNYIIYSLNTVRLWLPQLFAMVSDYENMETFGDSESDLCSMLSYSVNKSIANIQSINTNNTCVVVSILFFY